MEICVCSNNVVNAKPTEGQQLITLTDRGSILKPCSFITAHWCLAIAHVQELGVKSCLLMFSNHLDAMTR